MLKPSAVTGIDDLKRVPPLLKSLGGFLGFGVELNQMQLQCQARLAQNTGTVNQKTFVDACGTFEGESLEKLGDKMTAGESVIAEVTALEAACANITFSRKDPSTQVTVALLALESSVCFRWLVLLRITRTRILS